MISTAIPADQAKKIFDDIIKARVDHNTSMYNNATLLINANNGHRFIEVDKIVDCSITDQPLG